MSTQILSNLITVVKENVKADVPLRNLQVKFYSKLFGMQSGLGNVEYDHTFFYYQIGEYSNFAASKDILISRINETLLQINDYSGSHVVNRYDPNFIMIKMARVN